VTAYDEQYDYVVVGLGALGSATAYHLARAGHRVLGLEQFELGHSRGASHDTSRILRHSYHTPEYVRLTFDAYDDWEVLERDCGDSLVTRVGGLDLFPPDAAIPIGDYTRSMDACGVDYQVLKREDVRRRWPQFHLPHGTVGLYQDRASIVPAARGTAAMQAQATRFGARLLPHSRVVGLGDLGPETVVLTPERTYRAGRVVVCADAWTGSLLSHLGLAFNLTVTLEQVTYFRPADPAPYQQGRLPLWIWMDDPCYYGFPCYGEDTVKAAQDCSEIETSADTRPFEPDATRTREIKAFMSALLPDSGPVAASKTCLYTLPPDRDFVVGPLPDHPDVLVGLGAGHAFKFAPTLGRLLGELATTGTTAADIGAFAPGRDALTKQDQSVHWLV